MRGRNSIYLPFFADNRENENSKGRSESLIRRRDLKLVYRYYFYTFYKRLSFEDTVRQLSFEFDIADRTITDRLTKHNDNIAQIMDAKPEILELKKQFPYFSWN